MRSSCRKGDQDDDQGVTHEGGIETIEEEEVLQDAEPPVEKLPFGGLGITPWKFNIAPEDIPSEKESSLPTIFFQGLW